MSARLSEPSGLDDLLPRKLGRLPALGGSMVIRLRDADRRRGSRPRPEMG